MTDASPPTRVRDLLDARTAARTARDWARADALRDEIASLGWEVQDSEAGSAARPMLEAAVRDELPSLLEAPAELELGIQVLAEDHADDLRRFLTGLARHQPSVAWELVAVANAPSFDVARLLAEVDLPTAVVESNGRLGWADAVTLGLRRSRARITVLLDTSLEPEGDAWTPLVAAFEDPTVGIAGGWGVRSGDAREFSEAPPGEVDAVEAYCLAIRREALRAVGGFDRHYRFYRNADLDFSFAVRDAGWRAVRTHRLPFVRHEHRGWASLPAEERDRLSKRNFYRFLKRWGARRDLLLEPDDAR